MGISIWGDDERLLTPAEERLIKKVFRTTRLPDFHRIRIRNGLSWTGTPITTPRDGPVNMSHGYPLQTEGEYLIMVGQRLFDGDVANDEPSTLVHEMTHVWQYKHGTLTEFHGAVAHAAYGIVRKTNSLYKYKVGQSWDSMGFEGQAQLVEDWFTDDKMSETSDKWYYILNVLMLDDDNARYMDLDELKAITPTPEPVDLPMPDRHVANEDIVFSDDYILRLLEQHIGPNDVSLMAARLRDLESYFRQYRKMRLAEALILATRLETNKPGDKLANSFHYRLSTGSRVKLVHILRGLA